MTASFALPLLLAAAPASPLATLRAQCEAQAADPKNPWALAHGVLALGRDFRARDGRRAADVMVHDFVQRDAQGRLFFPPYAADGTPVDAHTNLLTKTLVLARFPSSTAFPSASGPVRVADLLSSLERRFQEHPDDEAWWADSAWTLDVLADGFAPGEAAHFEGAGATRVDVGALMDRALDALGRADAALREGMARGAASVPKDKRGIYGHPCGGMHFIQALGRWARHPAVRRAWGERWTREVDVLFYRLGSERRQYQAAMSELPQYRLELLGQQLKFYGHWLETVSRLAGESSLELGPDRQRAVADAKELLRKTTDALVAERAFASMDELKKSRPQTYLDLIGDACHAAHALELAR